MKVYLFGLLLGVSATALGDVPRAECFPVEKLPASLREKAEATLLKAMDGEALFTIVGGLKPISSGWLQVSIDVEKPQTQEAEEARQVLAALRSGDEIVTGLQPFWRVYENRRSLEGFVFHRDSVKAKIAQYASFFAFYGITPSSHPIEALTFAEIDSTPRRNRGYGYLFGYPKDAVDFFVESEERYRHTKEFVKREFFSVPVFSGPSNRFVWAVPVGHRPTDEDLKIQREAEKILAMYRQLRPRYVGAGKPGIAKLVRDWFDDGAGRCSPKTAMRKAERAFAKAS